MNIIEKAEQRIYDLLERLTEAKLDLEHLPREIQDLRSFIALYQRFMKEDWAMEPAPEPEIEHHAAALMPGPITYTTGAAPEEEFEEIGGYGAEVVGTAGAPPWKPMKRRGGRKSWSDEESDRLERIIRAGEINPQNITRTVVDQFPGRTMHSVKAQYYILRKKMKAMTANQAPETPPILAPEQEPEPAEPEAPAAGDEAEETAPANDDGLVGKAIDQEYAFEGEVIKISDRDYAQLQRLYPKIDSLHRFLKKLDREFVKEGASRNWYVKMMMKIRAHSANMEAAA